MSLNCVTYKKNMIQKNIEALDIEYICENIRRCEKTVRYPEVYGSMINFVIKVNPTTKEDFIGLAHMVYGWMPTILKLKIDDGDLPKLLSKIKEGSLDESGLSSLKKIINNSVVGTSKFCHFINPDNYAIWDSRVCETIKGKQSTQNEINSINNYIKYNNKMNELKTQNLSDLRNELEKKIQLEGTESRLRLLELGLFLK